MATSTENISRKIESIKLNQDVLTLQILQTLFAYQTDYDIEKIISDTKIIREELFSSQPEDNVPF